VLCFGPRDGKQPTFVLLEEWVPPARSLEREEALAEIAKRYFAGHGPATLQDFVWWTGLKVSDARAALALAASHLERAGAGELWTGREIPAENGGSVVHLLPGFDEYLVGYRDRSAALAPDHAPKIVPWSNGMFLPTLVVQGRIAGTWKRTIQKQAVTVTVSPFRLLKKTEARGLAAAAERYGRFLGLPAELTVEE
jgi:hypothetical protein